MNLGRFHSAIHAVRQEIEQSNLIKHLANLQSTLQQSVSQPNPETAQAFRNSYEKLRSILDRAKSNTTFPTRRKIFHEIGAVELIGTGLANRINTVFTHNQITPANALEQLQIIVQEINVFYKNTQILDDAFGEMQIEYDDLEPGDFETGLSFPRELVGNDLESLENEIHKINFMMKTLQEVMGTGVGEVKVKTISASEWQFFLEVVPEVAGGLALAIERLVALYKSSLEIKALKKQLETKDLPDSVLKPLQEHIETTVKQKIRSIAEEFVEQHYKGGDEGRRNELKTQTSQAFRYLADRIDRGATVEVHGEPPEEPVPQEDSDPQAAEDKFMQYEKLKELAMSVNDKTASAAQLIISDEPILAIEHDNAKGE